MCYDWLNTSSRRKTILSFITVYLVIPTIIIIYTATSTNCGVTLDHKKNTTTEAYGVVKSTKIENITKCYEKFIFTNILEICEETSLKENYCNLTVYKGLNYTKGLENILAINKTFLVYYDYNSICYFDYQYKNCSKARSLTIASIILFALGLPLTLFCLCDW